MKYNYVLWGMGAIILTGAIFFQNPVRQWMYETFIRKYIYDPEVKQMPPRELGSRKAYHFFDCREPKEYEVSHLENAQLLGYDHPDFSLLEKVDPSDTLILYCSVGYRSQILAKKLTQMGFPHVYNLQGGIFQWIYEDREIFKDGEVTDEVHGYSPKWGALLSKGKKVY